MTDLDQRLAAHFARIAPGEAFDAALRVRLEAERERLARFDREAALRAAMAQRVQQREREYRAQRLTTWGLAAVGLAGIALVVWTSGWWAQLADGIGAGVAAGAAEVSTVDDGTLTQALLIAIPALVLLASLRPRWLAALRDALLG